MGNSSVAPLGIEVQTSQMEGDVGNEPLLVPIPPTLYLDHLDPAVETFRRTVADLQDNGIDDPPQMRPDHAANRLHRLQTTPHRPAQPTTDERNRHLAAIGASVQKSHHGVGVLDRATWHRSRDLKIPSNLSLLHLPPYAPELNPMENVYNDLKSNYLSNRVFEALEEINAQTQKA